MFARHRAPRMNRGRIAVSGAPLVINVSQAFVVDSVASALGIINVTQQFIVACEATASAYTPLAEASPILNFDLLDAASYVQAANLCTAITNKVSSVVWLPGVTNCPYEAAGYNGHPCLHPLAITDRIVSTEAAVLAALTGACNATIYYVAKPDAISQNGALFSVAQIAGTAGQRRWGTISTGNGRYNSSGRADNATGLTAATTAQDYSTAGNVVTWVMSGTTLSCFANNVATSLAGTTIDPTIGGTTSVTPTRAGIFAVPDNSADTPWIGRFCELWIFAAVHDAAAQTRVYNYLSTRWA